MNEFTEQFLVESRELAEQASADLLALEDRPADRDILERVFRGFHTLKGAAGIMEYAAMERLLHRAEDALQDVRSDRRTAEPVLIDALLACVGQLFRWFEVIAKTEQMPADAERDAGRIAAMFGGPSPAVPGDAAASQGDLLTWARTQGAATAAPSIAMRWRPDAESFFQGKDPLAAIEALPGLVALRVFPREPWPAAAELQTFVCNLVIEAVVAGSRDAVEAALQAQGGELEVIDLGPATSADRLSPEARAILEEQLRFLKMEAGATPGRVGAAARVAANVFTASGIDAGPVQRAGTNAAALTEAIELALKPAQPAAAAGAPAAAASASTTIRVDVEKIDDIVNLTGELLVVKNAIGHWARVAAGETDPKALADGLKVQQELLERHLADLQRSVFDLRVLPLERVFSRFPRLVRETAAALGKRVSFEIEGGETKADKAVVEALFEPLLHVIRNALDHGVEPSAQRIEAGKPETARILLRAWREADHVIVEIDDDGRGVDPAIVRRLAAVRGVAEASAIADMTDDQAVELIFAPGFSTSQSVTDLSGRGVGMDAVRAAIGRIGGDVSLANRPGQGLTVRLLLPFTIMLTRVMTVEAGGQMFGVPFDAIVETVRIPRAQIRPLAGGQAFVLREETIPVVNLARSLDLEPAGPSADACILVVWAGGLRAGLEIDRPGERMDMLLRPVEGLLSGMRAVAGTSLLGDGRVLIVLDLKALIE